MTIIYLKKGCIEKRKLSTKTCKLKLNALPKIRVYRLENVFKKHKSTDFVQKS